MSRYRISQPQSTEAWFNHLDEKLTKNSDELSVNDKCVAIDCEMVGVGDMGHESALARVSIVNYYGMELIDKYVKPKNTITDYRTPYSGITPKHLENADDLEDVKREVQELFKGNIIIGQSPGFDFKALELDGSDNEIRDTAQYYYLFGDKFGRRQPYNKKPSLKKLANEVLGLKIQQGTHDSVEDARMCMLLYRLKQNEWEANANTRMSLDIGKCGICGSLSHVNSRCPKNLMRQKSYIY